MNKRSQIKEGCSRILSQRDDTIHHWPGLIPGEELTDTFTGLPCKDNLMSIVGFGSLLSERSARSTFPELQNFRIARLQNWRRVFAHACDIFFDRGIAKIETGEYSSLSVEEHPSSEILVTMFEIEATSQSIEAFVAREHEFRFCAVQPETLDGSPDRFGVVCARNTDENYRQRRCPPDEFERRYGRHGIERLWRDDILPCRAYLRHCVLASRNLGDEVHDSFMNGTFLADRKTTIGEYLEQNPDIMLELPPESLRERYGG